MQQVLAFLPRRDHHGVIKSPFVIDPEKCVKCYTCIEACPFDAIQEVEIDG